jgi:hypothetical protein
MRLLLRAAAIVISRQRLALMVFVGLVAMLAIWLLTPSRPAQVDAGAAGDDIEVADPLQPRAILNRVWFDKYPDKPRETTQLWIFLSGGIALYERGSYYRVAMEIFDFERQNDRMVITSLQDKKSVTTPFKIERCDQEPFDLCLTIDTPARGPKTLYGFSHRGDQEAHAPSATAFRLAAEARAPVVPRH